MDNLRQSYKAKRQQYRRANRDRLPKKKLRNTAQAFRDGEGKNYIQCLQGMPRATRKAFVVGGKRLNKELWACCWMGWEALGFVSEVLKVFFTFSLHQQILQVLELKKRGHRGRRPQVWKMEQPRVTGESLTPGSPWELMDCIERQMISWQGLLVLKDLEDWGISLMTGERQILHWSSKKSWKDGPGNYRFIGSTLVSRKIMD